jgi:hypothetical protein
VRPSSRALFVVPYNLFFKQMSAPPHPVSSLAMTSICSVLT